MNKNLKKINDFLRSLFLKGLLTLLPLALTIAIFNVAFSVLSNWLKPFKKLEPAFLQNFPYAEIIVAVIIIFIVGFIVNVLLLKWLVAGVEKLIFKIPLVRPIYSGIKQLVHAFNPHDEESFKQVVLIEFPREGIYSLGFLTSQLPPQISPNQTERFFNVFVPTTPNPTTGFYVMTSEKNMLPVSITRQEAMALIISGGIIQPDRFENK